MPVCALPNSEGFIAVVNNVDVANCGGYILVNATEYNYMMEYTQVTATEIAQYFGLGFSLVFVVGYLSTYSVKLALQLIRMI